MDDILCLLYRLTLPIFVTKEILILWSGEYHNVAVSCVHFLATYL